MRIFAISDTHGFLPEIPECDILIHAGDICRCTDDHKFYNQHKFLDNEVYEWFKHAPADYRILVPGNHDLAFEELNRIYCMESPQQIKMLELRQKYADIGTHILIDKGAVTLDGIKIYGSPWQRWWHNWAWNSSQHDPERLLYKVFGAIPDDTDILVTHSPPYGIGDWLSNGTDFQHLGSHALIEANRRVKPPLHVFGHVHCAVGCYVEDDRTLCNASYVGEDYKPIDRAPYIFDFDIDTRKVTIPCHPA